MCKQTLAENGHKYWCGPSHKEKSTDDNCDKDRGVVGLSERRTMFCGSTGNTQWKTKGKAS